MATELEKKWIAAWRAAAPVLAEQRSKYLKSLPPESGAELLGCQDVADPATHGLAVFQAWLQRLHITLLKERIADLEAELERVKRDGNR